MDAQINLSRNEKERKSAIESHLERMRNLEEGGIVLDQFDEDIRPKLLDEAARQHLKDELEKWCKDFTSAAKYFRIEAESMLSEVGDNGDA